MPGSVRRLLRISLGHGMTPVSYTHLDVYKRQVDLFDPHALGDGVRMDAVVIERSADVADLGQLRHTQAEVVVLRATEALVDAARRVEGRAPHQAEMESHEVEKHPVLGEGNPAAVAVAACLAVQMCIRDRPPSTWSRRPSSRSCPTADS